MSRSWGWREQWSSQDVDGVDTRHHLATICTLPSPSYLSYLWHGTIMYLTHTHLSSQRRTLALILSLVPSLLSQKSLACSESPDLNFIKSLLFMNHESFICKLWSFARNTVFLGQPISDYTKIIAQEQPQIQSSLAPRPCPVSRVCDGEASSAQWAATRDHWRGVVTYNKRSHSGGTQYYKC